MKSQKLIVIAAIVCLLVGASGAAMAQETCAEGILEGTEEFPLEVAGDIIIDGRSCFIHNVIVKGNVIATNSEQLTMIDNLVEGDVRVIGGRNAIIILNTVRNLVVRHNEMAAVAINVAARTIRVNGTIYKATVKRNGAAVAIVCRNNGRLDAFENEAPANECRSLGGGFGGLGDGDFLDEP
jgi:DNA/RNA endonuclease YhcR with UshA esterase domain